MGEAVRLNKYLSDSGLCSRREADRLIEAGKVLVDGVPAVKGMKVQPGQEVICDGRTAGGKEKPVFLVVNKPRGIVCTTSDKDRAENIVEFLNYPQRVYPVGRLDKDSEGLLLMTNQGEIVNKILRGGNNHEKEYAVAVSKPVTEEFLEKMRKGVWLEELEVTTKPCRAWQTGSHTFHIVLTQGLNRQIRRMCRALDYHVMKLKRVRIMNIQLGDLERGQYRELTAEEIKEIKRLIEDSTDLPLKEARKVRKAEESQKEKGIREAEPIRKTEEGQNQGKDRKSEKKRRFEDIKSRMEKPAGRPEGQKRRPKAADGRGFGAEGHRLVRVVRRPETRMEGSGQNG